MIAHTNTHMRELPLYSAERKKHGHTHALSYRHKDVLTQTKFNADRKYYVVKTDPNKIDHFFNVFSFEKMAFDFKGKETYCLQHFYRLQVLLQKVFSVHMVDTTS